MLMQVVQKPVTFLAALLNSRCLFERYIPLGASKRGPRHTIYTRLKKAALSGIFWTSDDRSAVLIVGFRDKHWVV